MPTPSKPDDTVQKKVPGSKLHFTDAGVNDRFNVPDWFPKDHAPMPDVVAHGRKPKVFACGFCHLPNGQGRPENASLAGQPAQYIIEQVTEMKEGRRRTSQPSMGSIKSMYQVAAAVSPGETQNCGRLFLEVEIQEMDPRGGNRSVPKFDISSHNMLVKSKAGGSEPIGNRIVRDSGRFGVWLNFAIPVPGFIAYVPKGSIARGKKLVQSGNGAFPCTSCHGASLKGDGNVPSLAGRSPSEIVRQLV